MRKQSWQERLIPLFYSAGIIKGLSSNNYAPKVDTPLSCSHYEWQWGVCVVGKNKKVRGGKGAWVCKRVFRCEYVCVCVFVKRVNKAWSEPNYPKYHATQKSLISTEHTPVNSEHKSDISFARCNTSPRESPTRNIWRSRMRVSVKREIPNHGVSEDVESTGSHCSVKLMGDEVTRGDIRALPHICRSLTDLTLEITDKD